MMSIAKRSGRHASHYFVKLAALGQRRGNRHEMNLEIDLRGATSIDRSAAAVLASMASRGARILTPES
jgi:hypothetical protein